MSPLERKDLLEEIHKLIIKANQNIQTLQFDIKQTQFKKEFESKLQRLRESLNQCQLTFNEKKKGYKYEIQLDQEKQMLDYIDNEGPEMFGQLNSVANNTDIDQVQLTDFLKNGISQPDQENLNSHKKQTWLENMNKSGKKDGVTDDKNNKN